MAEGWLNLPPLGEGLSPHFCSSALTLSRLPPAPRLPLGRLCPAGAASRRSRWPLTPSLPSRCRAEHLYSLLEIRYKTWCIYMNNS